MQSLIQDGEVSEIISFHNCQGGLGVTLAEYQLSDNRKPTSRYILVQNILTDGRAASDGRLRLGDKLLRINGQPIDGMTLADAVATLGTAIESGRATLAVSRDPELAAAFNLSNVNGSKPNHDADGDQRGRDNAGSPEGVVDQRRSVSEQNGFPADASEDGSSLTQNGNDDAVGSRRTVGADCQRSTNSSASLFPHLLTDSGSPLSEIGHEPGSDRGQSFPVCSTPNSSVVDAANAIAWQTTVENPKSRRLPVGRMTRDTFVDASKVKLEKLEQAMSFLGIHLTKEQEAEIRLLAEPDGTGRMDYGKFVQKMRQLLQSRLSLLCQHSEATASVPAVALLQQQQQERRVAPSLQPSPVAAAGLQTSVYTPLASMLENTGSPRQSKLGSLAQVAAAAPTLVNSHSSHQSGGRKKARLHSIAQQTDTDDMGYVGHLQQQIRDLERALKAKDQLCHATELKAASMRKKLVLSAGQCESLQSRLELAEAAQQASRKAESDYEAVLSALELTLGSKQRLTEQGGDNSTETPATLKKVAILGCQLRKAEEIRKVYEVATERLLSFARAVYDLADKSCAGDTGGSTEKLLGEGGEEKAKGDAHALSISDTQQLADEALNVIKATHSLLEKQPLPFGWEEAYTADGKKYYLNHVTEETIWHHPLTKVDRRKR